MSACSAGLGISFFLSFGCLLPITQYQRVYHTRAEADAVMRIRWGKEEYHLPYMSVSWAIQRCSVAVVLRPGGWLEHFLTPLAKAGVGIVFHPGSQCLIGRQHQRGMSMMESTSHAGKSWQHAPCQPSLTTC